MKTIKLTISTCASIVGTTCLIAIAAMTWWVPAGSGALPFWVTLGLLAVMAACMIIRVVSTIADVGRS